MATIFDNIPWTSWELRYDSDLDITYRYNSRTEAWEVNWAWTPSSSWLPSWWNTTWDIREDVDTGKSYRWNWSAWVLITKAWDTDEDGTPNTVEDLGITTAKLANNAVTKAKTTITVYDLTVVWWQNSWTVNVPAWSIILWVVPVSNFNYSMVQSVYITWTVLSLILSENATQDNSFKISCIV